MSDGAAWRTWPLPEPGVDLWQWQDGRCAMCGHDRVRIVRDHCHDTGFIRGLLCSGCNTQEGTTPPGHGWDEWRNGDTPARAIGELELYRNQFNVTPIGSSSALSYYTDAEQRDWWAASEAAFAERGEWPVTAPWTDEATERKTVLHAHALDALSRMFTRPDTDKAAS